MADAQTMSAFIRQALTALKAWAKRWFGPDQDPSPEWQRAIELIAAIDAGGVPLNPARVNDIARKLGLEVSTRASVEDTISRVRAALEYRRLHER